MLESLKALKADAVEGAVAEIDKLTKKVSETILEDETIINGHATQARNMMATLEGQAETLRREKRSLQAMLDFRAGMREFVEANIAEYSGEMGNKD